MNTLIQDRVELARSGSNPKVIGRMPSGWAVLGDTQFLAGYCVLLADPVVASLNDLDTQARSQFLLDMVALGDALLSVTDALRINYEILGNADPALHAHVFPRYRSEPAERAMGPVWLYERDQFNSVTFEATRHRAIMRSLFDSVHARADISGPGPVVRDGVYG